MAARPTTPASPKVAKIKSPVPGTPVFGCEHVQRLMTQSPEVMNTSIQHYKAILRSIFDTTPIVPQTSTNASGQPVTSLTSNFLCLQCPTTVTEEDRSKHGVKKHHRFYVESRNGALYCQMCDDYVWDPTLEELRLRKIGTGSFSTRKRKHDELFSDSMKDDPRYISINTTAASCRAAGLRGIYNAGATCYQNVILQSFLHNPMLRNFYLSDGHQSSECQVPHCMSCAMDDIFQDFYAQENTNGYTASNILSGFWISERKAFENLVTTKEQDAHEFFQFLAEELHERNGDGLRPQSGSEHSCTCIIHQTFYGKMQSTTTCQHCHGVTNQVQSFLDLNVGLESLSQRRKKAAASAAAAAKAAEAKAKAKANSNVNADSINANSNINANSSVNASPHPDATPNANNASRGGTEVTADGADSSSGSSSGTAITNNKNHNDNDRDSNQDSANNNSNNKNGNSNNITPVPTPTPPPPRPKPSLPPLSLQECLDEEYIKSDKCEYRCHNCNSTQQARRHTSIKRLPNVLCIQLKRFEYKAGRHDKAVKIDTPVTFPLQLNMFPYTNRGRSMDSRENYELARSCTYDLLSVVVHVGEIDTGHYVSYCRVGDQWFVFNDHRVELAAKSDVLSAKAYLLFYIIRTLA